MHFNFLFPTDKVHHTTGCLIQGLHQLGHTVEANYTPSFPENITSNGIFPPYSQSKINFISETKNFSKPLVIIDASHGWGNLEVQIEQESTKRNLVIINMDDNVMFVPHNEHIHVFNAHQNRFIKRWGKNYPLGFGPSQEAVDFAATFPTRKRKPAIFYNFRPTDRQCVRNTLELSLIPNLRKIIEVEQVFSSVKDYPNLLASYQAMLCYGGLLYKDYRLNDTVFHDGVPLQVNFTSIPDYPVIGRFDSWRLYEAALFGVAPITLNFEKYGLDTGANPLPWVEYIPVEFDTVESLPEEIERRLKADPDFLIKIGNNARQWVLKNHTPVALAQRWISKLSELNLI